MRGHPDWIEIVAFGIDVPAQNQQFGAALLDRIIEKAVDGDLGANVVGLACVSRSEACTQMLVRLGFAYNETGKAHFLRIRSDMPSR